MNQSAPVHFKGNSETYWFRYLERHASGTLGMDLQDKIVSKTETRTLRLHTCH